MAHEVPKSEQIDEVRSIKKYFRDNLTSDSQSAKDKAEATLRDYLYVVGREITGDLQKVSFEEPILVIDEIPVFLSDFNAAGLYEFEVDPRILLKTRLLFSLYLTRTKGHDTKEDSSVLDG